MKQRGRKTDSPLAPVAAILDSRPPPLAGLTKAQAEIWQDVVKAKPASWFKSDTHELLANYCRHAVEARRISSMIDSFESDWIKQDDGLARYKELLRIRDAETKAMLNHGRAMRINQHTLLKAETAHTQSDRVNTDKRMPWDDEALDG